MTGADGRVRATHVRIRLGNMQSSIIRRPIHLYRLEVNNCLKVATPLPSEGTPSVQIQTFNECLNPEVIID